MLLAFFNNLWFWRAVAGGPRYFLAAAKPRAFLVKGAGQMINTPSKLVVEVWNIGIDFTQQLQAGEVPTTGFATVPTGTAEVTFDGLSGNVASITVSGGTAGQRSIVQVGINTSAGEVLAENVQIPVC